MADLARERELLSLAQAAARLPGRPHPASVGRWALKGIRAGDGSRVRLEHVRVGRRLYVAAEALEHFVAQCTRADIRAAEEREAAAPPAREPIAARIARQAAVVAELERSGL